jgi:hypothetical protein
MPQDFYVKLPFYVTEGTVPRYVSVSFAGETVIPKTEIVSRDIANPDILEFYVNKDFGIYNMVISIPDHSFEEQGAVMLKYFQISPNGVDWYDIVATLGMKNSDQSDVIPLDPDVTKRPKMSVACGFWFGDPVDFHIEIPAVWNERYEFPTLEASIEEDIRVINHPDTTSGRKAQLEENLLKKQALLNFLKNND